MFDLAFVEKREGGGGDAQVPGILLAELAAPEVLVERQGLVVGGAADGVHGEESPPLGAVLGRHASHPISSSVSFKAFKA